MQLAQVNVAQLVAPIDAPEIEGFVALLDPINAAADRALGFVWRLEADDGNATSIRAYDDERIIVNLSVWRSLETLRAFVFDGDHVAVLRRRRDWFLRMEPPTSALWWVEDGARPTASEGRERLERLAADGPTGQAFTFQRPFSPDA